MVVLQENFLLPQWKRNELNSFNILLTLRLEDDWLAKESNKLMIGRIVTDSSQEICSCCKGGRKRYRKEKVNRERMKADLDIARDCITRASESSWWEYCG